MIAGTLSRWNREEERTALTRCGLHPNAAAVSLDNTLDDGKSQSCAPGLAFRGLPEAIEYVRQLIARDPTSGVCDREQNFTGAQFGAQNDLSAGLSELYRVADEIFEDLEEPVVVGPGFAIVLRLTKAKFDRRRGCQQRLRLDHFGK